MTQAECLAELRNCGPGAVRVIGLFGRTSGLRNVVKPPEPGIRGRFWAVSDHHDLPFFHGKSSVHLTWTEFFSRHAKTWWRDAGANSPWQQFRSETELPSIQKLVKEQPASDGWGCETTVRFSLLIEIFAVR